MHDQLTMARRMIYASTCAYEIYNDGTTPSKSPGTDRRVNSGKGYFYDVVELYQREVGFIEGPETYDPQFFSDGSDDINAALVGLTHDGYAVVAIRGTIPPSLKDDDLMQWIKDWANDADLSPVGWKALVGDLTGGGYSAPGKFTYFDSDHVLVPGADVTTSALPAVVNALKAETYSKIADAHSATSSYLPCFPPLIVPP